MPTMYTLKAAPTLRFASATEAVCYALSHGLNPNWEAVAA